MASQDPFGDAGLAPPLRNPFMDPLREYASSRSDLLRPTPSGLDPEKEYFERAQPYSNAFEPAPKRRNVLVRMLRKTWVIVLLVLIILGLCVALPVALHVAKSSGSKTAEDRVGTFTNPEDLPAIPMAKLIDSETPKEVLTSKAYEDGAEYNLVFSDEFNTDGRTFYPGDDPFWEAVDLQYWQTGNLEWYDPAAITTKNGSLEITLSAKQTHGMNYEGGMMSTWNKFCFTGGRIEASVQLPGANNVMGLWPAVWAMGNLGRAGYGASLEGMWPYTYDACDVGTLPNQTMNGLPVAATAGGDPAEGGVLSYLPGQRLSRCTCEGESHPGPKHSDGSFVGRSAPEIDVIEATVSTRGGEVSMSSQWAPFNAGYQWLNETANYEIADPTITELNAYKGAVFQQAISSLILTNQNCYELSGGCYSVYGFEYKPGFDDAYITWIADNKVGWTLRAGGVAPDPQVQISARPIPQEPMYLIANLGISENFGFIDFAHLTFPTVMRIDWIRVYQPADAINVGCDPEDFPTSTYINQYMEAYTNPNLTTWVDDFKQPFPKNSLVDTC